MFHVIRKATKGGESIFLDGFYCAEKLKQTHPDDFEFLISKSIQPVFIKTNSYMIKAENKVITINPLTGQLNQIRYNPYYKANLTHLTKDEIISYYKAIQKFGKIIQDPDNYVEFSLRPDQVIVFNNHRLLHGRTAFEGNRALVTSYISKDDWLTKASLFGLNF